LQMVDQDGSTHPVSTIGVPFYIHVLPVNDPPVLVPYWLVPTETAPLGNACDEDTFIRIRFNGTDEDGPVSHIRAQILTIADPLQTRLFVCNKKQHSNPANNCTTGHQLTDVEFLTSWEDGVWEFSVVPMPNWNGKLRFDFVVWDDYTFSVPSSTCPVNVLPINDPPSIVKSSTIIDLERYQCTNSTGSNGQVLNTTCALVSNIVGGTKFTIKDGNAVDPRVLEGEDISTPRPQSNKKDPQSQVGDENLLLVNRLRTIVQDIDFFFGDELVITGELYNAHFVEPSLLDQHYQHYGVTCTNSHKIQNGQVVSSNIFVQCKGIITELNNYLSVTGLPIVIDNQRKKRDVQTQYTSGFGLFVIGDEGNIDKWQRPLQTTFTIEFYSPVPLAGAPVPIAVIALLPIVVAAVSALVAAAWLLLGSRAAEVVTQNFDAFATVQAGCGNISPVYDDQGFHAVNPDQQ